MTAAKQDTARLARIEEALGSLGLDVKGKVQDLDRAALARLAAEGVELVDVHFTRWEQRVGVSGYRSRHPVGLPSALRVSLQELMGDFPSWLYQRHGGGEYEVDLTAADNPEFGVVYRFRANVHGQPRKPESVLQNDAARKVGTFEAAAALAKQLEGAGIAGPQAWSTAQQMVKENPYLAVGTAGAAKDEDDDMNIANLMMLMQQQERAAEREREARREQRLEEQREWERRQAITAAQQAPRGPDPAIAALEARLAAAEREAKEAREEARRQAERAETNAKIERLERLILESSTKKPEVDPTTTAIASMTQLFGALSQRGSAEQAAAAAQNSELMKLVFAANQGRAQEFQALVEAQLKGAAFQLDVEKLKMEQPTQYANVIASLMGMFGGLAKAQAELSMAMNQGNPVLDAMREAGAAIPQLIQGLIGGETTRAGSYSEPQAPGNDDAALARDLEIARRAMAGRAVTAPPEARQVATTEPQAIGGGDGTRQAEGSGGGAVRGATGAATDQGEAGGPQGEEPTAGAAAPGEGAPRPDAPAAGAQSGARGARGESDGVGVSGGAGDGGEGGDAEAEDGGEHVLTLAEGQAKALEMLTVLGLDKAEGLLVDEDGVNIVLDLTDLEGAPSEQARRLADAVAGLEAAVPFHPETVAEALKTYFGWPGQRAGIFVRAFLQRMTELAAAAA